jgi:steroid delta-isomerase-like uncharacterized protein
VKSPTVLDLATGYFDAWNRREPDAIVSVFAEGGTYEDPATGRPLSGDALAGYTRGLFEAVPDLSFEIRTLAQTAEDRVAAQWLMTGRNKISLPGADFISLDDAGIQTVEGYFDQQTFAEQIGLQVLVQPPESGSARLGSGMWVDTGRTRLPGATRSRPGPARRASAPCARRHRSAVPRGRPLDPLPRVRVHGSRQRAGPGLPLRSGARDHDPAHLTTGGPMKSHTVYKTFETERRRQFVRITEDVQAAVDEAQIAEGMALVSAMHITAGVWVNDDEPGIQQDALEWLDKLAPPSWQPPANEVAEKLLPDPGDYRHHRGGEDNGDAHLKNLLVHHQVVVPVTEGRLDLGPWQAIFYTEFDGRRRKRLIIKVLGE